MLLLCSPQSLEFLFFAGAHWETHVSQTALFIQREPLSIKQRKTITLSTVQTERILNIQNEVKFTITYKNMLLKQTEIVYIKNENGLVRFGLISIRLMWQIRCGCHLRAINPEMSTVQSGSVVALWSSGMWALSHCCVSRWRRISACYCRPRSQVLHKRISAAAWRVEPARHRPGCPRNKSSATAARPDFNWHLTASAGLAWGTKHQKGYYCDYWKFPTWDSFIT